MRFAYQNSHAVLADAVRRAGTAYQYMRARPRDRQCWGDLGSGDTDCAGKSFSGTTDVHSTAQAFMAVTANDGAVCPQTSTTAAPDIDDRHGDDHDLVASQCSQTLVSAAVMSLALAAAYRAVEVE